jgi:tetratricopeptide (TPR) repeat protein
MLSFSRNVRRADSASRPRALGAAVALALLGGTALAGEAHRFVFTAYGDAAGGADILSGRYQAALEELESHPDAMALDSSATNTNRCVAYSMTQQWREARAACDAAVRAAIEHRSGAPAWRGWTRKADDEYVALAYANRAVMYWLSGDDDDAHKDLAKAQGLSPGSDFVAQNLAALEVRAPVALAGESTPKS